MTPERTRTDDLLQAADLEHDEVDAVHLVHGPVPGLLGARLPIPEEGLILGRQQPWLEGALDDARISRRHVQLLSEGGRLAVSDLGSHNGTFVNGQRVRQATLQPGDVLGLGGLLLLFRPARPRRPRLPPPLVGCSDALAEVLEQVGLVAQRPTTVLLVGETGVGKELVARALHQRSARKGPMVAANCGALTGGLLLSELFGHTRGAFTGAERAREGLVVSAQGGTLLLDEVAEAPSEVQVALLRLLQERTVRPVGSDASREVDVRFVAATHRDLAEEVQAGRFRADLLHRLFRWVIRIPPLRERSEDIPLLVHHLARAHTPEPVRMSRELCLALLRHPWPGNVRELEAVVERLVVAGGPELGLHRWLEEQLHLPEAPPPQPHRARAQRPERAELEALLALHGGKVKAVAEALGVSRNSLYRWMREEGLDPSDHRD